MLSLQRPTAIIQRIITYFNGFVFISFCVLLFLFRNLKVAFILLFISVLYCWKFIIVFDKHTIECGSYTGLIMIVGIISENAILPIYSLKKHLLVRIIKAISSLCNFNPFKTKINDWL
jgi:multidrug efflux pump subunit AcrB